MKPWIKWTLIIVLILVVLYFLGVFDGMFSKKTTDPVEAEAAA